MSIESKVQQLESVSVDVLLEYLRDREPEKPLIERARIAQTSFASIQRRRSAENQKDALSFMMQKEGLGLTRLPSGSSDGGTTS